MRKLTALCLCVILLLGPAGCAAQPAETGASESSEVQTETAIPSSSAEESSSEILTAEAGPTDESETESSVSEESADNSTAEESADSSAAEPSAEISTDAETSAEDSTAESTEVPETTEEPTEETTEEPTAEYIIADTFLFMLPAGWERRDDGSLAAHGGSVRISFCTVPLSSEPFSEGIKIKDDDFGKQLVAWFNENGDSEVTYTIYDSDVADQTARTESGLDYRFILIIPHGDSNNKDSSILSAYNLDKENVLVIRFEYGLEAGIAAEECLETVNKTIERIQ